MNNKENAKQAFIGFTEFAKGITGNQNLKIPDDIANRYGIEQESCGMTTKEDDNVRNSYLAIKATQRQSCEEEDMAKAFQLGLALGLEEKHNKNEMDKEIKTLEDLENHCKENTGHGMNVPPFVYTDKYFEDVEKAYGNGYRAGYKEGFDYSIGEAELEELKKSITPQLCDDCISRKSVNDLVDELARTISDERSGISRGRSTAIIMQDILQLPSVIPQIIEADNGYEAEVIIRSKCMMCGKELTDGLFFCKECEDKVNNGKWNGKITLGEVVIGGHCKEKENGAEE